jgi:hypothetical protein
VIIPALINPLEDEKEDVRWETVKLIGHLVGYGEWQLASIAAY